NSLEPLEDPPENRRSHSFGSAGFRFQGSANRLQRLAARISGARPASPGRDSSGTPPQANDSGLQPGAWESASRAASQATCSPALARQVWAPSERRQAQLASLGPLAKVRRQPMSSVVVPAGRDRPCCCTCPTALGG